MAGVRAAAVVAAFFLGALFAIGSLLAALFEVQGFGSTGDQPRALYLASLGLALLVSVAGPFVVLRVVLPGSEARAWLLAVPALAVAFMLFGLTLTR